MTRPPRPTGDDLVFHAINRGNNRADVLAPDGERDAFLSDLARTKARYPFELFGYCLMSNHYPWSSHRCHGAGHADPLLDSFPEWEQLGRTEPERRARWRRKVRAEQPARDLDAVRASLRSGRPFGAEDWVEFVSHRLGIAREPRRRGRPPHEKTI
jgi:hypothetical protein